MIVVYVGKNLPGSSMYLVGQQIVANSNAVLATTIGESMKGASLVISIVLEDVPKIVKARRFLGIGRVILLLAANWEEYSDWDRGAILGYTLNNKMVVHSKYSLESVMTTAKEWLSPSMVRRLQNGNLVCALYGVSEEFSPSPRNPNKWIVPYNRVNQTQKNLNLHREITEKFQIMMRGSVDTTFILLQVWGSKPETTDLTCYHVVPQPEDREGYVQLIADKGGFLCTSNFESFGIYYLELLCSGCVGVFIDRPWVRLLLPGYQFIAKDKVEALAYMNSVVNNYTDCSAYLQNKVIPFIRRTYDLKKFSKLITEL